MSTMPRSRPEGRSRPSRGQSFGVQFLDLLLIELTNWRWSWRAMVVTGALAPVFSMLALGVFARDAGPTALAYVLTGNMVISLLFGNMGSVQHHFAFMRFRGTLDFMATLPVRRHALILAVVASFLLLSMPAIALTLLLGTLYLGVPLHPSPWLLVAIPASAVCLSGVGAFVGVTTRTPEEGGALTNIITLLLAAMGPVVVPPDRVPPALTFLGRLSPATYAASAFRQALLGPVTAQIWLDLAVLVAAGGLLLWYVGRRMDWRCAG